MININLPLFAFNGQWITLWNLVVLVVILWISSLLPRPLREIFWVLVVLWALSIFGIISFAGLQQLIIVAVVLGVIFSLFHH